MKLATGSDSYTPSKEVALEVATALPIHLLKQAPRVDVLREEILAPALPGWIPSTTTWIILMSESNLVFPYSDEVER